MSVNASKTTMSVKPSKPPVKQSQRLQYLRPDPTKTGKKNSGAIGQYPYFAPDAAYLKTAPKMTKAEELYLKKLTAAVHAQEAAEVPEHVLARPEGKVVGPARAEIDKDPNPRLLKERNPLTDKLGRFFQKKTRTAAIFAEKPEDDESAPLQQRAKGDWSSTAPMPSAAREAADYEERAGNVVPFFPVDWSKHANYVYDNTRAEPGPQRKGRNEAPGPEYSMWYDAGEQAPQPGPPQPQVDGARPTSGKHYARRNGDAYAEPKRYLGDLVDRSGDPLRSAVAEDYSNTRKVQGLLDKLAGYMGEGFDKDDFLAAVRGTPEDEQTTPRRRGKKETRNLGPGSLPVGSLAPIRESLVGLASTQAYVKPAMAIEAEDYAAPGGDYPDRLPELDDNQLQGRFRRKKGSLPPVDNLFTYKEMAFGLTGVGGNQNRYPGIGQTTTKEDREQITDNLL